MSARANEKKSPARIAVPYYGQLVRAGVGIEKIYFVAEIKPDSREVRHITLRVWNPHEVPELAGWLRKKRVSGVICSDTTLKCHYDFAAEGIWVMGGQKGEVAEIIRRWVAGSNRDAVMLAGPSYGRADGLGSSVRFAARSMTVSISHI
jgi:predicted Fe-Mo cluster-binding NifX family protein